MDEIMKFEADIMTFEGPCWDEVMTFEGPYMDQLMTFEADWCSARHSRARRRHHSQVHHRQGQAGTPYTLHPTPSFLHPAPYTLHPIPYTLHPTYLSSSSSLCICCGTTEAHAAAEHKVRAIFIVAIRRHNFVTQVVVQIMKARRRAHGRPTACTPHP